MSKLSLTFCGLSFKNPIVTSSGCFGFGYEYTQFFNPNILGGITLKGLTLLPREGNLGTRVTETPAGMLNCVGLENPGIEVFKEEILPILTNTTNDTNIIANINGNTVEEYVSLAKEVDKIDLIKLIEINVSCPNVKCGGMSFGTNPDMVAQVTKAVREVTKKPIIVKLSPNVTDIVSIAKQAEANGANAISVINTLLGMAIDIKTKKPVLCNTFGGLSGPCVKPVALRIVYQLYQALSIPIIGMGGIDSAEDILEFMMAGASMVSIGSCLFNKPHLPEQCLAYLEKYCEDNHLSNLQEIVGIAHRK